MLIPMFAYELPPTDYALRMKPVFIGCLIVLAALVVGKFAISDFWGAISLMLVVAMGAFCLTGESGLNVTNCLFFAVMALISGIFDVIACVLYMQHSKYALFDTKAPTMVLVAQSVFVLSPVMLFISGCLAYSIYGDARRVSEESAPLGGGMGGNQYYDTPQQPPPRPNRPEAQPFQGQGQRLGSN